MNWFTYALLALILWGLWGFFPRLAVNYISPKSILIFESFGSLLVGLFVLIFTRKIELHPLSTVLSILAGITGALGALFFIIALKKGNTYVVVAMTALYPLITIFLCYVALHEPIKFRQMLGIIFAVIAMVLFAG